MDSRNLGNEFNQRHAPNKLEFNTGRYHILRDIYQKFGRVFFVKRISVLKNRTQFHLLTYGSSEPVDGSASIYFQ